MSAHTFGPKMLNSVSKNLSHLLPRSCILRNALLAGKQDSRLLTISQFYSKKVTAPATGAATARPGIDVEKDPEKLVKFCCGANYFKEGTDPEIKPDYEYPEWLWNLKIDRNWEKLEDMDKNTFRYWRKIRKANLVAWNKRQQLKYK